MGAEQSNISHNVTPLELYSPSVSNLEPSTPENAQALINWVFNTKENAFKGKLLVRDINPDGSVYTAMDSWITTYEAPPFPIPDIGIYHNGYVDYRGIWHRESWTLGPKEVIRKILLGQREKQGGLIDLSNRL